MALARAILGRIRASQCGCVATVLPLDGVGALDGGPFVWALVVAGMGSSAGGHDLAGRLDLWDVDCNELERISVAGRIGPDRMGLLALFFTRISSASKSIGVVGVCWGGTAPDDLTGLASKESSTDVGTIAGPVRSRRLGRAVPL